MSKNLQRRFMLVRQGVTQAKRISVLIYVGFHGSLFTLVPEPPAPLVGSFMNRYTVEPCLQAAFAIKTLHTAKNFEKDFLCGVRSVRRVGQNAVHKAVNRLVIVSHKPVVSLFRAGFEFG